MKFEYFLKKLADAELEIDDIGNCAIRATTLLKDEYYLLIFTELGYTELLIYGPCAPDLRTLCHDYKIEYNRFDYNQLKIERTIDKFLNNPKYGIVKADVVTLPEIREFLVNPIDRLLYSKDDIINDE